MFAYRNYNGLALTADLPVPTEAPANAVLTDLSGDLSSETFYKISVPAGATSFKVSTEGGTGNVDLRVRVGRVPVCQPSQVVRRRYATSIELRRAMEIRKV